jgi:ankyrin repeat protein
MLSSEIVVHQLLDAGADAAAEDTTGCIPLHLACQRGRESIAQILLDAFPGVTAKNNSGWTPLHFAAKKGLETSAQVSPPEPET